jgi:hypothetical protein
MDDSHIPRVVSTINDKHITFTDPRVNSLLDVILKIELEMSNILIPILGGDTSIALYCGSVVFIIHLQGIVALFEDVHLRSQIARHARWWNVFSGDYLFPWR